MAVQGGIFGLGPEWTNALLDVVGAVGNGPTNNLAQYREQQHRQVQRQRQEEEYQREQEQQRFEESQYPMIQQQLGLSPDQTRLYMQSPAYRTLVNQQMAAKSKGAKPKAPKVPTDNERQLIATHLEEDESLDFLSEKERGAMAADMASIASRYRQENPEGTLEDSWRYAYGQLRGRAVDKPWYTSGPEYERPVLGNKYTPENIKFTAEKYGISEDEVRKRLGIE